MTRSRVLVVDDNAMNIVIAEVALAAAGFEVASACSAAEGRRKIESFRPQLILMDIQMPDLDGLEFTRQLKADPAARHIVIVAFTAFAMRGDEEKMRAAGCDGYVSKPIDVKKFAAQVRACLDAAAGDGHASFGAVESA